MKDIWKEAEEGVVKKVNKKKIAITIPRNRKNNIIPLF